MKFVSPSGEETMLLNDTAHISDNVSGCGDGRYIVFRRVNRAGSAAVNLWRMDANGSNVTQLTFGQNDREPECSRDGKWVYYTNQSAITNCFKRVPVDGGKPETVVNEPIGQFRLVAGR